MAEQPLQDSEVARLLKDYSLSIQEDIRSRLPPGVLTWVPPSLTASTPKTGSSPGSAIEGSSFFEDITQHRNPRYLKALCLLVILLIECKFFSVSIIHRLIFFLNCFWPLKIVRLFSLCLPIFSSWLSLLRKCSEHIESKHQTGNST